jgi:hypothetical protein
MKHVPQEQRRLMAGRHAAREAPGVMAVLAVMVAVGAADGGLPALVSAKQEAVTFAEGASCQRPVFAPGGARAAVFVAKGGGGEVVVVDVATREGRAVWSAGPGAKVTCSWITFSPDGAKLAALLRYEKAGTVRRSVVIGPPAGPLEWLGVESMTYEFAFSPDGTRLALATRAGLIVAAAKAGAKGKLWLAGPSTEQRRAPYTRIQLAPDNAFAVAVGPIRPPFTVGGQGEGVVAFADGRHVKLPVSTPYLSISADGRRIAAAVWTHSPVGVERPGGLKVWSVADLRAGRSAGRFAIDPKRYICGLHVYPGAVFWIDGRPSCLGTALKPEPGQVYRRFGVWQATDGGEPRRRTVVGPMPKRMWPDPGARGRVFWRYYARRGTFLLDERTGRCWRLDDKIATSQYKLAFSDDLKRLAVVKGNQLLLHALREEKRK